MKTSFISVTLIFLLLVQCFSQESRKHFSLNQCIELATSNNLELQRSIIKANSARINWQQARADLLPKLELGIEHGVNQGRSIDPLSNSYINNEFIYASPYVNGSLLLFNGLKFRNLIKQNSFIYQSANQEQQQVKDDLTLNVILVYLQVLTNQDLFDLSKIRQETTIKQLERLEVLQKNGAIAPKDYYDLKGQYAAERLALVNSGNDLENSKISLTELMNITYSKDIRVENLPIDSFLNEYKLGPQEVYNNAVKKNHEIKAADFQKKSADVKLKVLKSGYLPSIYFNTGLYSNFSNAARDLEGLPIGYLSQFRNNLSKGFSVGITLPIFNNFKTRNEILIAKQNQRENELLVQSVRIKLQNIIEQSYFNMISSQERFSSLKCQVEAFTESFRIAEIHFQNGVINSVDYLIAKNNLDQARINMIISRYDFILRKKIIDFYQNESIF